MNKKGQVGMIIMITIGLIIGIVIFQIIQVLITDQTGTVSIISDEFTANNNTCVQVTTDCIEESSGVIVNGSTTVTGNFTECNLNNPGKINGYLLLPSVGGKEHDAGTMNASYTEISCSFIGGGLTTTVINLLPLLFAVALLVFVAGFAILKR